MSPVVVIGLPVIDNVARGVVSPTDDTVPPPAEEFIVIWLLAADLTNSILLPSTNSTELERELTLSVFIKVWVPDAVEICIEAPEPEPPETFVKTAPGP